MEIIKRKALILGHFLVKVEECGASCQEIKDFIETNHANRILCGRSDRFMLFAHSIANHCLMDGEPAHIWGDTDEFRKNEGLSPNQRVEGIAVKGTPPYRLRYAPSTKDAPLSMDDPYDGGWIFCSAR